MANVWQGAALKCIVRRMTLRRRGGGGFEVYLSSNNPSFSLLGAKWMTKNSPQDDICRTGNMIYAHLSSSTIQLKLEFMGSMYSINCGKKNFPSTFNRSSTIVFSILKMFSLVHSFLEGEY
jgi:hypothetical protein